MSNDALGKTLLALARASIAHHFGAPMPEAVATPEYIRMQQPGACFVTLTKQGRLRGCIGTLEAWRALQDDVRENALAAAFRDPRFPPLSATELAETRVEVSLLSSPQPMTFRCESDALAQLQPGLDGIVLEHAGHRATFLPQVWEQLPEPVQFMAHLKQKAGLPAEFWSDNIRLSRYRVEKWKEA